MIQNGLKPIKRNSKRWYPTDLSFHRNFGGITPLEFPREFSVDLGITMPDQNAIGLPLGCTGVTQNELCTDQDGIVYDDYEYTYRKTLELEGVYELNKQGCDIRNSLKIICTLGPKTKEEGDEDGEKKARGAYYAIESSKFDWFDSFRSVMLTNHQNNNTKCAISIGTPWFQEWNSQSVGNNGIVPSVFVYNGDPYSISWHNWAIKGWKEINGKPYLIAKTWQGKNYGNTGWSYYDRETINAVMKIRYTGAYTVAPRDASNIQTVRLTLMEVIIRLCQNAIDLLLKKKSVEPFNTPPEPPILPEVESNNQMTELEWSNPKTIRHSIRILCDIEGLSYKDKNDLCATIQAESNFNLYAKNENKKNGKLLSTDWGLCQINDYWNIGVGKPFPSVDFVLNNPEKVVRWMIGEWKKGENSKNKWIAYKNKSYKRYL